MIGRVYKVQHLDSSLCYIGSTCNTIRDRWSSHKKSFKHWIMNKEGDRTISLYPYLEQYGIDRFQMLLIKEYQIIDKKQLMVYEQLAINRTNSCCNSRASFQLVNTNCMAKHYIQLISGPKRSIKIICECGLETRKGGISRHRKSARHIKLLATLKASSSL